MLGGAGILLLAGSGLAASGANFAASSANPNAGFTAGIVHQSNSSAGVAVLSAPNLAPGATAIGTVDITNTGDLLAVQSLTARNLTDTPASANFSAYLKLKLEDLGAPGCVSGCPAAVVVYTGTLRGLVGTRDLATFQPTEKRRYRFTVTYPNAGPNGADNAYAGAGASVDLAWGARQ
jgi:hypothetical protein